MSNEDEAKFRAGIYRLMGPLTDALERNTAMLAKLAEMLVRAPVQQTLPGLAEDDTGNDAPDGCVWTLPGMPTEDWTPPDVESIPPPPPERRRVTKLYDALWCEYKGEPFSLGDLLGRASVWSDLYAAGSLNKALTVIRKAGCAKPRQTGSRATAALYCLVEPTDEMRDALDACDEACGHKRRTA